MWHVVTSPFGEFASALIAFLPLLWLLISLGLIKMTGHKACIIGLILSMAIAVWGWHMPVILAARAALEGIVLAIWPVIWVIVAAIFTYNVTTKTGAMDKIKTQMANLSGDRRVQALIVAWGFGGFLEGVAGFGTAVAIPASILIGLGFDPFFAAVLCLLADTVPVAFGAVGIPVTLLAKIAGLNTMNLTYAVTLQLTPFVIFLPLILILIMTKSLKGLKGVWHTALVAGLGFAVSQLLIAKFVGPELAAIVSAIVSTACVVVWVKLFTPAEEWRFPHERQVKSVPHVSVGAMAAKESLGFSEMLIAWSPYILLFILIIGTSTLVPAVNKPLSQFRSFLHIYNGPGGKPLNIDWIVTPGTMITIAAIIGGLFQGASMTSLANIFNKTLVQLQKTMVTVMAIVALAKVMGYSGMIAAIAIALAKITGPFYPIFAPAIGALGTFVTGSDTSSNVLFGALQKQTALQIGANPTWVTASNTTGATAGKMISPQSISVATSATGQDGKDGEILAVTIKYCLVYVILVGILVYVFA
jgi:lactate permease